MSTTKVTLPQGVMPTFMNSLANHPYTSANDFQKHAVDDAIRASSSFGSLDEFKDAIKAAQLAAERKAVEEVLGAAYAGKTMSELGSNLLNASAKLYDLKKIGNAFYNEKNDRRSTVERLIKERKAYIFLEEFCGVQLPNKYWIREDDVVTYWSGDVSGNVDTGALTGSDANIILKEGDVINGKVITAADIRKLAKLEGVTTSGDTITIGTGVEKTDRSVVPEVGNFYRASTSQAQNIDTGTRDAIVKATSYNDTITSNGADSIDAGDGNDKFIANADGATLITGAGADDVTIAASVNEITLADLTSVDSVKILGTFNPNSARLENEILVIADRSGKRTLRLGNLESAKYATVNGTKIGDWLKNFGINLNNLSDASSYTLPEDDTARAEEITSAKKFTAQVETEIPKGVDVESDYESSQLKSVQSNQSRSLPEKNFYSSGAININLDDVTIESGSVVVNGQTVGEISSAFPNVERFTKQGCTFYLAGVSNSTDGHPDTVQYKSLAQLSDDERTVFAGIYKWWAAEDLKLIKKSYGLSFDSSAMVKEIGVYFYHGQGKSNALASVWNWQRISSDGTTTKLMLNINMDYYAGLAANDVDGKSSATSALADRTLAHELTHALMAAQTRYFQKLPGFVKEGATAELVHGIDDERGHRIFELAANSDKLAAVLDESDTDINIYAGGFIFARALVKQSTLQSITEYLADADDEPKIIVLTEKNDSRVIKEDNVLVEALGGDDSITVCAGNVSLDAGPGQNYVYNFGRELPPSERDGHSVYNGEKNFFTFGDGDNIFINDEGRNLKIITGDGNNSIANCSEVSEIQLQTGDGDNTVTGESCWNSKFFTGAGDDKFKLGGDNLSISSGAGDDQGTISGGGSALIDLGEGDDSLTFNHSFYSDVVSVSGNLGNDLFINDYTINGCAHPAVRFYYETGNGLDTIVGLKDHDTIVIDDGAGEYSTVKSGDAVKILVSDGSILLKDAENFSSLNIEGVEIFDEAADEPFWSINGTTATYGTESKTLATLTGLAKGLKAIDGEIVGISVNDDIISLAQNVLGTKKVTLKSSDYSLALGEDVQEVEPYDSTWTRKSKTATLTQKNSAGYVLADDEKSISYVKETTTTLGTVKGVKHDLSEENFFDEKIFLTSDDVNTKVTVSGAVEFEFADDYKGYITGSAKSDTISVLGPGVTINAGAGDDYISGSGGGNTFLYAIGNGADVIADFTAGDKFKVTKGKINTVTMDDKENVLIKIKSGKKVDTVTLQDAGYWFDEMTYTSTELGIPIDALTDNYRRQSFATLELTSETSAFAKSGTVFADAANYNILTTKSIDK